MEHMGTSADRKTCGAMQGLATFMVSSASCKAAKRAERSVEGLIPVVEVIYRRLSLLPLQVGNLWTPETEAT